MSGILAGGILGFRNVDCCFLHLMAIFDFCVVLFAFQVARADYSTKMLS